MEVFSQSALTWYLSILLFTGTNVRPLLRTDVPASWNWCFHWTDWSGLMFPPQHTLICRTKRLLSPSLQTLSSRRAIGDYFTCMSENLVYCISCRRCSHIYIGETGQSLRSRIGEHLRSVRNNTPGFPEAQHFNSAGHSITDVQVRGMHLCRGSNILREQLEMRLIFQLRTVQPGGRNIDFKYVWTVHALLFTRTYFLLTQLQMYCIF